MFLSVIIVVNNEDLELCESYRSCFFICLKMYMQHAGSMYEVIVSCNIVVRMTPNIKISLIHSFIHMFHERFFVKQVNVMDEAIYGRC